MKLTNRSCIKKSAASFVLLLILIIMTSSSAVALSTDDFKTSTINGNELKITGYTGTDGTISIPKYISGQLVTTIADDAFFGNSYLEKAVLSESVTTIGESAFRSCANLEVVYLLGSVRTIQKETFKYCLKLTDVNISNGCEVIEESAFYGCKTLEAVILPASLKHIGKDAFTDCDNMEIFFYGTESQWKNIVIEEGNDILSKTNITVDAGGDPYVISNSSDVSYAESSAYESRPVIEESSKTTTESGTDNSQYIYDTQETEDTIYPGYPGVKKIDENVVPHTKQKTKSGIVVFSALVGIFAMISIIMVMVKIDKRKKD